MKKSDIALFCLLMVIIALYIVFPSLGVNVTGVKVSLNIVFGTFLLGFLLGGMLKKLDLKRDTETPPSGQDHG